MYYTQLKNNNFKAIKKIQINFEREQSVKTKNESEDKWNRKNGKQIELSLIIGC